MTRRQAARSIEAYLAAWRSNAPADIESLFTPDAVYFTTPHRTPWQGQREIVQGWLGRADDQDDWDFHYGVLHVTDDTLPMCAGGRSTWTAWCALATRSKCREGGRPEVVVSTGA